jgi:hypothetical protein
LGLVLWYKMLRIMESKGKSVNYFWVTPTQLLAFNKIIKEESDPNSKLQYRMILWAQIILIPIYLIGMSLIL